MTIVGHHENDEGLSLNSSTLYSCKVPVYDPQLTAIAFMLQRSEGKFPLHPDLVDDALAQAAIDSIKGPQTGGGILADTMGFGKTITSLTFLNLRAVLLSQALYKPTLILVPSALVLDQWIRMNAGFPDLVFIQVYGVQPKGALKVNWVSPYALAQGADNLDLWPEHLRYVFDTSNPSARKAILFTTYNTWTRKSGKLVIVDRESGEMEFQSNYRDKFECLIADEGHVLRHADTQNHVAVKEIAADTVWLVTAIPILNDQRDILGHLKLLWPRAVKLLGANSQHLQWLKRPEASKTSKSYSIFAELKNLPIDDIRRLIALDPARISTLLGTGDVLEIARNHHFCDDLICIRRSTASVLEYDDIRCLKLTAMMPAHEVRTVELKWRRNEAPEFEWFHRSAARQYIEAIERWLMSSKSNKDSEGIEKEKDFPNVSAHLRHLTLFSTSLLLGRFELVRAVLDKTSLSSDINRLRKANFNAHHFIKAVHRTGDPPVKTGVEKLNFFAYGSPKLRFLLSQLSEYVLPGNPKSAKLLCLEQFPNCGWFHQLACSLLHIECDVLHSQLAAKERIELVKRFQDEKDGLRVLIVMYNVDSQGVNLDGCCCRVLVLTPAINGPIELQGWGRVIRVSQKNLVLIIRLMADNSHDIYRISRQGDKILLSLATLSLSPEIRTLLVDLLNKADKQVQDAHNSKKGQALLKGRLTINSESAFMMPEIDVSLSTKRQSRTVRLPSRYNEDGSTKRKIPSYIASLYDDEDSDSSHKKRRNKKDHDEDFENHSESEDTLSESDNEIEEENGSKDTISDLKRQFYTLTRSEKEAFDQELMNIRILLKLVPGRAYTDSDLNDTDILARALRLLYDAAFGVPHSEIRISPHINYSNLPANITSNIAQKNLLEKEQLHDIMNIMST